MYNLLERMIESAEKKDASEVTKLISQYTKLSVKVYKNPQTELDSEYDNCAVSCQASVGVAVHIHDDLIRDAKERFSRIPKPE